MINKSPIFIVRVSYIFFSLLAIFRFTVYTLSVCLSFSFSLPILLFYFSRVFSLLLAKITLCRLGIKSRSCSDVIWHIIHCSVLTFSTFLKKWIKSRTKPRKSVQLLLLATVSVVAIRWQWLNPVLICGTQFFIWIGIQLCWVGNFVYTLLLET